MWWASVPKNFKNKASLYLFILGMVFGTMSYLIFVFDPLKILVQKFSELKPDSILFGYWKNSPYDFIGSIYIFNVTNSEAFLNGKEKLNITEVGPYVYRELPYNTNISFNSNGTLSFISRRRLELVLEQSVGNPYKDYVTVPNVPLLGVISSVAEESIFIRLAVGQLSLAFTADEFVNITVNDYLFGYEDNLISAANQLLPNRFDFSKFGIVDRLMALDNGSNIMSISLDTKKYNDISLYTLSEFKGSGTLSQWSNDGLGNNSSCAVIRGCCSTTIFPPDLQKNSKLLLYRHGFCRPIPLEYSHSDTTKYSFETYTFTINDNFLAPDNPESQCYCPKLPCRLKGVGDMSPCYYNVPIALSQPHFLNGDPDLFKRINGLSPDFQKHNLYMVIHPESGLPVELKFRLQINLNVPGTQFNYRTRPFNNLVLPLIWFELAIDDPPAFVMVGLPLLYVFLPLVQKFIKIIFAIFAVVLPSIAIWMFLSGTCNKNEYLLLNYKRNSKLKISR